MLRQASTKPPRSAAQRAPMRGSPHPYRRTTPSATTGERRLLLLLPVRTLDDAHSRMLRHFEVPSSANNGDLEVETLRHSVERLHLKFQDRAGFQPTGLKASEWRTYVTYVAGGIEAVKLASEPADFAHLLRGWELSRHAHGQSNAVSRTPTMAARQLLSVLAATPNGTFATADQEAAARALAACWRQGGMPSLGRCATLLAARETLCFHYNSPPAPAQTHKHDAAGSVEAITANFQRLNIVDDATGMEKVAARSKKASLSLEARPALTRAPSSHHSSASDGGQEPWVVVSGYATPLRSRSSSPPALPTHSQAPFDKLQGHAAPPEAALAQPPAPVLGAPAEAGTPRPKGGAEATVWASSLRARLGWSGAKGQTHV